MLAYPGPDSSFEDVDVEALADCALRIAHGVAQIVGRDRFEDHAGRVGFIFPCGRGEFVEALAALQHLKGSEPVLSSSFLDGEF